MHKDDEKSKSVNTIPEPKCEIKSVNLNEKTLETSVSCSLESFITNDRREYSNTLNQSNSKMKICISHDEQQVGEITDLNYRSRQSISCGSQTEDTNTISLDDTYNICGMDQCVCQFIESTITTRIGNSGYSETSSSWDNSNSKAALSQSGNSKCSIKIEKVNHRIQSKCSIKIEKVHQRSQSKCSIKMEKVRDGVQQSCPILIDEKVNRERVPPSMEKTDNYTIGNHLAESKCDKDGICHYLHSQPMPEWIKSMKRDEEINKKQDKHRETIPKQNIDCSSSVRIKRSNIIYNIERIVNDYPESNTYQITVTNLNGETSATNLDNLIEILRLVTLYRVFEKIK